MAELSEELQQELEDQLRPVVEIADPRERYRLAAEAEAFHRATAHSFVELRALSAHELHERGDSYAQIARFVGLTRARAQQLVEMGRAITRESHHLRERSARAAAWSRVLRDRSDRVHERARTLVGGRRSEHATKGDGGDGR